MGSERGITLNRVVREGLSEEVTFEWDLNVGKEGVTQKSFQAEERAYAKSLR